MIFEELLDNMAEGILIFSKDGVISWCNKGSVNLFEESKPQLIGCNVKKYLCNDLRMGDCRFLVGTQRKQICVSDLLSLDNGSTAMVFREVPLQPTETDSSLKYKELPKKADFHYNFGKIQGQNIKFCETIAMARKAATTLSPVLIYGETGTGKELFAQSIHNASERSDQPFVAINCAAIPENLLEGIIFGTVQGAFTDAINRPGLFEQACKGTIFLDEINSMPLSLQAKLLRVIQEKTLRRVGGVSDIYINPRIISSLNVEPFDAVAQGLLRNDLFYRLGVVCLEIPPLRERKDDLPLLTDYFTNKACEKLNKPKKSVSSEVLEILKQNDWPGNVRQFEHAIECAVNFADHETQISLYDFPRYLRFVSIDHQEPVVMDIDNNMSLKTEMEKVERNKVITILEQAGGSISLAAKMLGMSRQSLYYRMNKYSININNRLTG